MQPPTKFSDAGWHLQKGGFHRALLHCALALSFSVMDCLAASTLYVGLHFEVRAHDAPVKYVFNGGTRVARVTGSLSASERIQRLRLRAGWNLVSLAVSAPDLPGQLAELTTGPTPVIQALYRWQPATRDYGRIASGESVAAGTVLWISARADAVVPVRGGYVEPAGWRAPAGGTFVGAPGLEAQPLAVPLGVTLWRYEAQSGRWQFGHTGDLAALSDLPSTLAPGEAIYVQSSEATDLIAPAREDRIHYYHQDHLGSSSVMTDIEGQLLAETAFYPFGEARSSHRVRQVDEPYQFTQKERDQESGLDYFEARYLAGSKARFISVDPKYANTEECASNPQTLNLYAYVQSNPLQFTDPTGLEPAPAPSLTEIAHMAAVSDTKAASENDKGTFMKIMEVGATITTGVCDQAFGCGMGGYQVTRSIVVEGYNVDTSSKLYKGSMIAGTVLAFAVPVPPIAGIAGKATTAARAEQAVVTTGAGTMRSATTRAVVSQAEGTAAKTISAARAGKAAGAAEKLTLEEANFVKDLVSSGAMDAREAIRTVVEARAAYQAPKAAGGVKTGWRNLK